MTGAGVYAGLTSDEVVLLHRWAERWGLPAGDAVAIGALRHTFGFQAMLLRYRFGALLITVGRAVQRRARP